MIYVTSQVTFIFLTQICYNNMNSWSHEKKYSGNSVTSFVYVMFMPWPVPGLSARGQNLAGSFNIIILDKVLEEI